MGISPPCTIIFKLFHFYIFFFALNYLMTYQHNYFGTNSAYHESGDSWRFLTGKYFCSLRVLLTYPALGNTTNHRLIMLLLDKLSTAFISDLKLKNHVLYEKLYLAKWSEIEYDSRDLGNIENGFKVKERRNFYTLLLICCCGSLGEWCDCCTMSSIHSATRLITQLWG